MNEEYQITEAKWLDATTIIAVINGAQCCVPNVSTNPHRMALAQWENEGNVIAPMEQPV